MRQPTGIFAVRLVALFLLGSIASAGCSGEQNRAKVTAINPIDDQATPSGEQPKRPVHSLGPEMRRTKAPPKR